ncbi:MAG: diacylglycerol kinase family protein [Phycisphaerae bacterium]|nr:diacylglycerol kinase family protein [Phycisphaerae bacterium]
MNQLPNQSTWKNTFRFAWAGLIYLLRTQRNARIHVVAAFAACGLGWYVRLPGTQWAILVLTITIVFILEGINTAIEATVDLASPQIHPLAKTAKDVCAAMVLVAAFTAVLVGLLLFLPPMMARFHAAASR